eukprot:GHVT01097649.1.p1 GENE.GHVT01097649.1~~GHVT01097649.1.p1  ORF type:complete len:175 (+),score=21.60 GHVT01097649.1:248-772(+)
MKIQLPSSVTLKAQIALDKKLPVHMADLEHIDKPEVLNMLLSEKEVLAQCREEVLNAPKGTYSQPPSIKKYRLPEVPRALRPEYHPTWDWVQAQGVEHYEAALTLDGAIQEHFGKERRVEGIQFTDESTPLEKRVELFKVPSSKAKAPSEKQLPIKSLKQMEAGDDSQLQGISQ